MLLYAINNYTDWYHQNHLSHALQNPQIKQYSSCYFIYLLTCTVTTTDYNILPEGLVFSFLFFSLFSSLLNRFLCYFNWFLQRLSLHGCTEYCTDKRFSFSNSGTNLILYLKHSASCASFVVPSPSLIKRAEHRVFLRGQTRHLHFP